MGSEAPYCDGGQSDICLLIIQQLPNPILLIFHNKTIPPNLYAIKSFEKSTKIILKVMEPRTPT